MCHHVDDAFDDYYEQLVRGFEESREARKSRESQTPDHLSDEAPEVEVELLTDGSGEE